jgi:glutamate/tyrosine decarboxylase-like PLP-dependent enzyme
MTHQLPRSVASLFPNATDKKQWDDFLTTELVAAQHRVTNGPVVPTFDITKFRNELKAFDFGTSRPPAETLLWAISQLEHGVVHITNPRYFGLFNPAPTAPAQWADRIAATFNPQLATWTTSPAAVEIENHVISAVARRAGFHADAQGHFTSGGAEANATALICALTNADMRFALDGVTAFRGRPMIYASRDSHLAWLKIAHQAGIGRSAVRLLNTDGSGRLDPRALEEAITQDQLSGCIPVMVVATCGTTNAGMIDPLCDCARIARAANAWFHIDAAWGGAFIASENSRQAIAGIELADSVTIDAHKWFATTMGCGMFMTRRPAILSQAFEVVTSYMPSGIRDVDPYTTSIQWSRRFLGLRLFLSLAVAGWKGYADHVERAVKATEVLRDLLVTDGWSVVNDSPLAVLCVLPPRPRDSRSCVSSVVTSGRAWISVARFEQEEVIRICMTHGETSLDDIKDLVAALKYSAR